MTKLSVRGSSDDIILIEKDGILYEEFYSNCDGRTHVSFNDGTVLSISYDDEGIWRINLINQGSAKFSKVECEIETEDNYSDVVTIEGDINWVSAGKIKRIK